MVNETNRNARQKIAEGLTEHSRLKSWADTDVAEMKLFIGILLWMGLVKLPRISSYWSRDKLYINGVASAVMTRNRFQLLLKMWHFSDNEDPLATTDRLHKIRYVMNSLIDNFAAARQPSENITVDETMVPFRGS